MVSQRDERGMPRSGSPVQSIDRAVELLDRIARSGASGVPLKGLADATGLKTTTAHSLLVALIANGLVEQPADLGGHYRLGTRAFELGRQYTANTDLVDAGSRAARELRSTLSETVFVSVLRNGRRVDLVNLIGPKPLSINTAAYEATGRAPSERLHASSVGKVLLAGLGRESARAVLAAQPLDTFTPNTVDRVDSVLDELDLVTERGWATNREESDLGVCGIAAPVRDSSGRAIAALCVAFPAVRSSEEYDAVIVDELTRSARRLSRDLGYVDEGEE